MKVCLHIPAYNEEYTIRRCLESVIKQDYDKSLWCCVVVDNNSTDKTTQIVEDFINSNPEFNIKLVHELQKGVFYARKRGMDYGVENNFDILAGTDSDSQLSQNLISNIAKVLHESYIDAYSGILDIEQGIKNAYDWMQLYWDIRLAIKRLWCSYMGEEFNGNNFALKKAKYIEIGGFPIRPWNAGEDVVLAEEVIKHGGKIIYSDKSPVTVSDRRFLQENNSGGGSHLPKKKQVEVDFNQ